MAKILIIDDKEYGARSFASFLISEGYQAKVTCDPHLFMDMMEGESPDLALVDVMMPEITGDRLVQMAREKLGSDCCPMLLWSSKPPDELQELARACGADGFIYKTCDPYEVLLTIRQYVR